MNTEIIDVSKLSLLDDDKLESIVADFSSKHDFNPRKERISRLADQLGIRCYIGEKSAPGPTLIFKDMGNVWASVTPDMSIVAINAHLSLAIAYHALKENGALSPITDVILTGGNTPPELTFALRRFVAMLVMPKEAFLITKRNLGREARVGTLAIAFGTTKELVSLRLKQLKL